MMINNTYSGRRTGRAKLFLLLCFIFFVIALPVSCCADFNFTTTADFDAGTKSEPLLHDGNWEVETRTDNPYIPSGELWLTNKYGDNFTYADPNGLTWKWEDASYMLGSCGTYSRDIDTTFDNGYYFYAEYTAPVGNNALAESALNSVNLTGDFDIRISINVTDFTGSGNMWFYLYVYNNSNDWARIGFNNNYGAKRINSQIKDGGAVGTSTYNFGILETYDFSVRILRKGTNLTTWYDLNSGNSWTKLGENTGVITGNMVIGLVGQTRLNTAGNYIEGYFQKFNVTGTKTGTEYKTSGEWTTPFINMSGCQALKNITFNVTDARLLDVIDKVQIINSTGNVVSTANADIITSTTYDASDFDNGFGMINASDFKIKLFFSAQADDSIYLTELSGFFEASPNLDISSSVGFCPYLSIASTLFLIFFGCALFFILAGLKYNIRTLILLGAFLLMLCAMLLIMNGIDYYDGLCSDCVSVSCVYTSIKNAFTNGLAIILSLSAIWIMFRTLIGR